MVVTYSKQGGGAYLFFFPAVVFSPKRASAEDRQQFRCVSSHYTDGQDVVLLEQAKNCCYLYYIILLLLPSVSHSHLMTIISFKRGGPNRPSVFGRLNMRVIPSTHTHKKTAKGADVWTASPTCEQDGPPPSTRYFDTTFRRRHISGNSHRLTIIAEPKGNAKKSKNNIRHYIMRCHIRLLRGSL